VLSQLDRGTWLGTRDDTPLEGLQQTHVHQQQRSQPTKHIWLESGHTAAQLDWGQVDRKKKGSSSHGMQKMVDRSDVIGVHILHQADTWGSHQRDRGKGPRCNATKQRILKTRWGRYAADQEMLDAAPTAFSQL
jgi:hypothetical protein